MPSVNKSVLASPLLVSHYGRQVKNIFHKKPPTKTLHSCICVSLVFHTHAGRLQMKKDPQQIR